MPQYSIFTDNEELSVKQSDSSGQSTLSMKKSAALHRVDPASANASHVRSTTIQASIETTWSP